MSPFTVLLADNQPLTVAGLRYLLNESPEITIIGQVSIHDRLHDLLKKHQPNLLIADYHTPGCVTQVDLATVKLSSPQTNTLVLSADTDNARILDVLRTGVIGYLKKDSSREEIMMAVHAVAKGEKFFSHEILNIIMDKRFSPEVAVPRPALLTARELEILTLLASGYSTQKIADKIHLSPHTVHTHRKRIIKKLNIKSPTQFVIHALDYGLITPKYSS